MPTNADILFKTAFKGKRSTPGRLMLSSQEIEREGGILKELKGALSIFIIWQNFNLVQVLSTMNRKLKQGSNK